ncbi:dihydrofolate reductase family protein [Subtercola sp. PAMC28395]|uniref:dihydrofolate reductase family protein n=1 Tax=Subtercola sp. PAMC28395 TaxID=2846775 RepID=UPI001C0C569A|nr:dihydrofolate reductase family protein [Subtercola sp. PAMC28395]QWT23786.1 dihydrofolate reductase family protein [Subtercola sp. PAMC28395]
MAGRFVYWMNVSLDLFIDSKPGEHNDLEGPGWVRLSEQLHLEFNARARRLSMMVEGRIVYEMMDPFWPDARTDESLPAYAREFGEIWTDMPKVLVSRTRTTAGHNTRIIGGVGSGVGSGVGDGSGAGGDGLSGGGFSGDGADNAIAQLAELRQRTEGDIGIGGATLATQLLRANLLDELLLFTHPVVLGAGRPLFDTLDQPLAKPLQLDLLEQGNFDRGVTMHRYAIS